MSGGRASRQKGDRFERACVAALHALGLPAHRVPLSGSAGGEYGDDLRVDLGLGRLTVECKTRARAWLDLFGWLVPAGGKRPPDVLLIKADRTDTLVVMRLETFAKLAHGGQETWSA